MSLPVYATVEAARKNNRCRVCGGVIQVLSAPKGWQYQFGKMVFPERIILDYGNEFAHADCLPKPTTP